MKGLICMRLSTAGLIVGWLGFFMSLVSVFVFVMCFERLDDLSKMISEQMGAPETDIERVRRILTFVCSLYLGINLINMLASGLLIIGITREKPILLVPWLFNIGLWLFFNFIYFLYFATTSMKPDRTLTLPVITAAISLSFHFAIWCVIYMLYRQILGHQEHQHLLHTTDSKVYHQNNLQHNHHDRNRKPPKKKNPEKKKPKKNLNFHPDTSPSSPQSSNTSQNLPPNTPHPLIPQNIVPPHPDQLHNQQPLHSQNTIHNAHYGLHQIIPFIGHNSQHIGTTTTTALPQNLHPG